MTIEHSMDQLSALYSQACQGQPAVVVITGDAGIGKTWLVQQAVARLTADFSAPDVAIVVPYYKHDTPLVLTRRLLTRWQTRLDTILNSQTDLLAEKAAKLGLKMDLMFDWLATLNSREARLEQIRQHLPWLKKMTPGLKADVDDLLDLLASPWLGIAQKRKARQQEFLDSKTPSELAHVLVDEWVWLHQLLPAGQTPAIWSVWLDGMDVLPCVAANDDWHKWHNALITAVATAEQLKALLVITCRADYLSRWLAPVFHRVSPVLLGPMPVKMQAQFLTQKLDGIPTDTDIWPRFASLTAGNPAYLTMLGMGLSQRKSLFLDGLTASRLDTLGLTTIRTLQDWWLVPLQLTPCIDYLSLSDIRQLLFIVAQQPEPFLAPTILAEAGIDQSQPQRLNAAFSLMQQLLHLQLIQPADQALHYQVCCRYVLEQLADRFSLVSQPEQPAYQQETLANVLEVTLLTGQLDQQQLTDLWQWCQQSDEPEPLTAWWITLAERALASPHQRVVMGGLVALSLAQKLNFAHLQPLLNRDGLAGMAWRLACDLPWQTLDQASIDAEEVQSILTVGLAHHQSDIRACALRCAQQANAVTEGSWLKAALNDPVPWVRRQALLALQDNPNTDLVPVNSLITLATQSEPDVLPVVLPLLLQRVPAETTVPIALEQWQQTEGAVQSQWLGFLRQVPLSTPVEQALLQALRATESPDLIWTLYQKLWRDAPNLHSTLQAMPPETAWPNWLKAAIQQRCAGAAQTVSLLLTAS